MAVVVYWSHHATETFNDNVLYLKQSWTDREIKKFILRTEIVILNIEQNPTLYTYSAKSKRIRKATINKHMTLFYRYNAAKKSVVLLSFWNNYRDQNKLLL